MPDMSRNTALAGKTVYSRGMNVTYDDNGYAVKASNPHYSGYEGTTRSVTAQPIADALAGNPWTPPDTSGLREWGRDTRAGRSTGGTGSAYDGSYGSGYPSAYDAQRAAGSLPSCDTALPSQRPLPRSPVPTRGSYAWRPPSHI